MSNNSVICDLDYTLNYLKINLPYVSYCVVPPIYFCIGIISRSICLIAFCKQYKKEKGFAYQILASLGDLFEVLAVTLGMLTINNLCGFRLPGALWYQKNYFLMYYAAHLSGPFSQGFITNALLMYLCMAADRVFAVWKPFLYKTTNHSRYQIISAIICLCIGLLTSVVDGLRFDVIDKGDKYEVVVNEIFTATRTAYVFGMTRNIIRFMANAMLVFCNVVLIILYCNNAKKVAVASKNEQSAQRKKATQRSLLFLTICQSIFMTADTTMYNAYYTLAYSIPSFTSCFGKVMAPFDDLTLQMAGILEFFALFAISKQFRKIIFTFVRCKNVEQATNSVAANQQNPASNIQ